MTYITPEEALYPLVTDWIQTQLKTSDFSGNVYGLQEAFVADTSRKPSADGGFWSRPDLAAALYSKPRFVPTLSVDLFSFEVKTALGIGESAVYEAVAHKRYANYSILVWQPTEGEKEIEKVVNLCEEFGVGALLAREPRNPRSYETLVRAKKSEVKNSVVDQFIANRFPKDERIRLEKWLRDQGWQIPEREGTL